MGGAEATCPICARVPGDPVGPVPLPAPAAADEWRAADRIRGALLGVAVGDAFGGMAHAGRRRPGHPRPASLPVGGATQLTLFTAEALVRMYIRYHSKGIGPAWEIIRHGLERWAFTQGEAMAAGSPGAGGIGWPGGWLVRAHVLHDRTPGFAAVRHGLRSPVSPVAVVLSRSSEVPGVTGSDGAGGIVRVAPAGLLFHVNDALRVGAVTAAFTHDGLQGRLAAGALARVLAGLLDERPLGRAIGDAIADLEGWQGHDAVAAALANLPAPVEGDTAAVRALSHGLAAAAGSPGDPVGAIEEAVVRGGTAAAVVAGAVAGTADGAAAFGPEWRLAPAAIVPLEAMGDVMALAHRALTLGRPPRGWEGTGREEHGDEPWVSLLLSAIHGA